MIDKEYLSICQLVISITVERFQASLLSLTSIQNLEFPQKCQSLQKQKGPTLHFPKIGVSKAGQHLQQTKEVYFLPQNRDFQNRPIFPKKAKALTLHFAPRSVIGPFFRKNKRG